MNERAVYRLALTYWSSLGALVVGALVLLAMADDGKSGPGTASPTARSVGYVLVLAFIPLIVRAWRAGVVITCDDVVVRGYLRTRRVGLAEVDRFALSESFPLRWDPFGYKTAVARGRPVRTPYASAWGAGGVCELWLKSGERVLIWQINAANPSQRDPFGMTRRAMKLIDRMNDDLATRLRPPA